MNFNFELILFYAVVTTGLIALFDMLFFARKRKKAFAEETKHLSPPPELKLPILVDYARAFFPILLIVFLLRAFFYEPFRIPSGSLEPTLFTGDFILVNKYHYGIRLPVIHQKIYLLNEPQRGDIVVFRWPPNPSLDFIKRIVGVPGDHISYISKTLYINGKEMPQDFIRNTVAYDEKGHKMDVKEAEENLSGIKHFIFQNGNAVSDDLVDVVVPDGMYFAMGDNRDNSADSRYWGFVPEENIIGKASWVWMSWDSILHRIRWDRLGKKIH